MFKRLVGETYAFVVDFVCAHTINADVRDDGKKLIRAKSVFACMLQLIVVAFSLLHRLPHITSHAHDVSDCISEAALFLFLQSAK